MAPNASHENIPQKMDYTEKITKAGPRSYDVVYWNVLVFLYYHVAGMYGFISLTTAMWSTILFDVLLFWLSGVGIIVGAHRLWSHKAFKAKIPLQVFLMLCQSIANQHSVVHWVRDHRLHHKFSDTDADPHNASRGFFYSHVGWLLVKKHPEVTRRGKLIDVTDVLNNPVLRFQHRHNMWFIPLLAFGLPTILPIFIWNETLSNAWHLNMLRYIIHLNLTFSINSFAHLWGNRPYDKNIAPGQNMLVYFVTLGEGFHNYHHVFPCDYQSNEFGRVFNCMSMFIDGCARLGQAFDLKTVSEKVAKARMERTGDGSKPGFKERFKKTNDCRR